MAKADKRGSRILKRADALATLLAFACLACFSVTVSELSGGRGFWPSFSGERVYAAHELLSGGEAVAAPQFVPRIAPEFASPEPVIERKAEGFESGSCKAEAREGSKAQYETKRKTVNRRPRFLTRRAVSSQNSKAV